MLAQDAPHFADGLGVFLHAVVRTHDALADHALDAGASIRDDAVGRLGRKLMAHAEQIAASSGHGEIRLYTNKLFAQNIELYRTLGYRIDREEVLTIGVAVHMSKPVGAAGGKL